MAMKRQREDEATERFDLANSLMLLSESRESKQTQKGSGSGSGSAILDQVFECKTCNRKFSSFQGLGGHRASHKKQKPDGEDLKAVAKSLSLGNKPKMHECSICGLQFSLGQALGGHMRKHRDASNQLQLSKIDQIAAKVPVLKGSNSKGISCSICGLEFSLGQALGGHMRKHKDASNQLQLSKIDQIAAKVPVLKRSNSKRISCLDLNLTPMENDLKLLFGEKAPQVHLSLMCQI